MHLFGFIIRIVHDAWSPECQIPLNIYILIVTVSFSNPRDNNIFAQ